MTLKSIIRRLHSELYILFNGPIFGSIGPDCRIYSPLKITGKKSIKLGRGVIIEHNAWLAAIPINDKEVARLEIGDGSHIGHFNHIYATQSIRIGDNVLTADRVYISDNAHGYQDVSMPVLHQPIRQINSVEIGEGAWLGEGVCVIGAKIGKGSVIGANAVVTTDIPDYSVAVGVPAKVIKRYNHNSKQWERVD